MSSISAPHFHDEEKSYEYVEARLWPNGAVCPHCGGVDRVGKLKGKTTRTGLWKCYQCRKPFTVKIGTIFEGSKVPMHKWLQAIFLVAGSKKGISSNQLHRILGVTLKTAWFMSHRIREAMRDDSGFPLGGLGSTVEVDETFIGREPDSKVGPSYHHKMKVVSLVERHSGRAQSYVVDKVSADEIAPIVARNVRRESKIMTDESPVYRFVPLHFYQHGRVNHSVGEYVRGTDHTNTIEGYFSIFKRGMRGIYQHGRVNHSVGEYVRGTDHTNTIEGYFSIFKRGMRGIYQHCSKKHLHRYLAEFDFRYSNRAATGVDDTERADAILQGVIGKRLTYETTRARA